MKISYNWLRQYINMNTGPQETADILTNIGLEVEGIETYESVEGGLEGIVIGEVRSCKKHPNADKLTITTVDIGQDRLLNIVCGASNVKTGQKVPVAVDGTILYYKDKPIKISKSKIRGETSEGMICAEDELGLGTSHEGILVLDKKAKAGTAVRDYFDIKTDIIYEIGLTPNRIDGASHYGTARDLAAFLNQTRKTKLIKPSVKSFKPDNSNNVIDVNIEDPVACPRYTGVTVSGVEVGISPDWLQNRLKSIGLTPINNIVDITNFVLLETGQPLHAFDADKIKGKKIIVKTLKEGTMFITLDEVKRELSDEDLMICNEEEGMCIAGIFGGIESGVTERTINIFLESAYFNPVNIRKTAKRHTLNTDASFRFERGVDPDMILYALKRAALLIKEIAGGEISSDIVDKYPTPIPDFEVNLVYSNLNRLVGKKINREEIKSILTSLEIKIINESEKGLKLTVPAYRVDVQREADVIEEILRIYGYNKIEINEKVQSTISYYEKPDKENVTNMISDLLTSNGFMEIISNSLTPSTYYNNSNVFPSKRTVKIFNPLSKDLNAMRQTLLFGGLESIAYNINHKNSDLKFYEFGNCYSYSKKPLKDQPLLNYHEQEHLSLFITGNKLQPGWNNPEQPGSFYSMKSFVERILIRLGFDSDNFKKTDSGSEIFSNGLLYCLKRYGIVEFGKLNPNLLNNFNIKQDVYYADFNWTHILNSIKTYSITYVDLPKHPEVKRDLALLLDKSIKFDQVKEVAQKTEKKLLKSVTLFDVFEDEKIGKDKKSYAVSFILQDENKTLTDNQIDKIMTKLIRAYEKELGAQIR
jgi:phenylalanyl-tRNA synthetase beta chain